jgi:hypothetical protein
MYNISGGGAIALAEALIKASVAVTSACFYFFCFFVFCFCFVLINYGEVRLVQSN